MPSRRKPSPAASRLIVALDLPTLGAAVRCAKRLQGLVRRVKIGSALFTAEGPEAVRRMRQLGFDVFLDLKFHDIPSTVEKSVRAAVPHRIWMLTVHASGQAQMLRSAVRGATDEAAKRRLPRPLIVGVSVLTSVEASGPALMRRVLTLAAHAQRAGLDGVVASAHEAAAIRRRLGSRLAIVCPGIRPASADEGDQSRVATPAKALKAGASFLVVGRPITQANNPGRAAQAILEEMTGGHTDPSPAGTRRRG